MLQCCATSTLSIVNHNMFNWLSVTKDKYTLFVKNLLAIIDILVRRDDHKFCYLLPENFFIFINWINRFLSVLVLSAMISFTFYSCICAFLLKVTILKIFVYIKLESVKKVVHDLFTISFLRLLLAQAMPHLRHNKFAESFAIFIKINCNI